MVAASIPLSVRAADLRSGGERSADAAGGRAEALPGDPGKHSGVDILYRQTVPSAHRARSGTHDLTSSSEPGVLLHRRTTLSRGVVTESAPPGRASFSHIGRRRTRVFDSAGSALRTPCP
jgi:hypothetical protein